MNVNTWPQEIGGRCWAEEDRTLIERRYRHLREGAGTAGDFDLFAQFCAANGYAIDPKHNGGYWIQITAFGKLRVQRKQLHLIKKKFR